MHLPIAMTNTTPAPKRKKNKHCRSKNDSVDAVVFYPDGTQISRTIRRRHLLSIATQSERMRHLNGGLVKIGEQKVVVDLRVYDFENAAHCRMRGTLQTVFGSDVTDHIKEVAA